MYDSNCGLLPTASPQAVPFICIRRARAMTADALTQSASTLRPAKPIRLREARFEDHAQVAALEAKFELVPKAYPEWRHLWSSNPAYRGIEGAFPIGWVLENADGVISGYLGNIPLTYELEGKKLLAATTRAWVVDESARGYALLLLGTYFRQRNVDIFLNTSVNASAAEAYNSFQGIPVPVGAWDRSLFWIAHYQGFAESFLRKQGGRTAKPLSYPLAAGAFLLDRLKRSGFRRAARAAEVQACAGFDERFDDFWKGLREKKSHLLLGVRDRETLDWHFKDGLAKGTAWLYTAEHNSGLAAYSVFDRHDYHPVGLTRMWLTDFQCLDNGNAPAYLAAMLKGALKRCREEGIHMLEVTGAGPWMQRVLEGASPHRRQLSNWRYFYKANNPALAEKLRDPAVWEPSFYDGDSSL